MFTFTFEFQAEEECYNNSINIHCEAVLIGFKLPVNTNHTAHICCLKGFAPLFI